MLNKITTNVIKKGAKYQITHAPQKWIDNMTANPADESVDETAKKRKPGNLKPVGLGRSMKVTLKASMCPGTTEDKLDPVGKADDDIDNDSTRKNTNNEQLYSCAQDYMLRPVWGPRAGIIILMI